MNTWHMLHKKACHNLIFHQWGDKCTKKGHERGRCRLTVSGLWRFAWAWSKESGAPPVKSGQPITCKSASRKRSINSVTVVLNVIQALKLGSVTHLHLGPMSRMSGALPLLPLYAFMVWKGKILLFNQDMLDYNTGPLTICYYP